MSGERITGIVLLSAVVVFAFAMLFVPMGEAWVQSDGVRTTNEFHFFTKDVEVAPANDPGDPTSSATWYYVDDGLADSGGITYLKAMGPLAVIGLVLTVAALVFTAVRRTHETRVGGWLALPGALFLFLAVVLAIIGMPMHAADQVASTAQINWNAGGAVLASLTITLSLLAAGMGITRIRRVVHTQADSDDWDAIDDTTTEDLDEDEATGWDDDPTDVDHETPAQTPADEPAPMPGPAHTATAETRLLKCPDCSTIVEAEIEVIPICPDCGFGSSDPTTPGTGTTTRQGTTA